MNHRDDLHGGFRHAYLGYEALTAQLQTWAERHPDVARLQSLGRTEEGRELWMLTIGRDPDRIRPSVWVDGNMHASELAGSNVAMAIAEDVLGLHLGSGAVTFGFPEHMLEAIREVTFHVMPRISPDGAEAVLEQGRWLRSVPRDARLERRSRWRSHDVDGDGLALLMRVQDPTGEYVESRDVPGLLALRQLEDAGPFYKVWPEGTIEHFDGRTIPSPAQTADNTPDLNRNFPYAWAPEHKQIGAGPFPLSEAESRAVVEFFGRNPQIFAWLNLHTFGGVFIRPLGDAPDTKMDPGDLAIWREIEGWCERITGYPMVSGFEEFTYSAETPLYGDCTEFGYHARGCLAYVCEIWDLFRQLGLPQGKRFVDQYTQFDREALIKLARWDAEHNRSRVIRPWKRFEHPQLGPVEIGGIDPRFGVWNPPPERLDEICRAQSEAFLRVVAMGPRLTAEVVRVEPLPGSDSLWTFELDVQNRGYLPTYVLPSAKVHPFNEPVHATIVTAGPRLLGSDDGAREVGHLEGWGRGRNTWFGTPAFFRSAGSVSRKAVQWVFDGPGTVTVRVGSCRVGWREVTVRSPERGASRGSEASLG